MSESFLSADWYRVAHLKARLRSHVEIHRQRFRGQVWYIVQDQHSGRYFRISPAGNMIVGMMDGRRTLQALWEIACDRFEDDPPTQPEVIRLLSQLHAADLIAGDVPPDIAEMGRRHHDMERRSMLMRLRNPLALRLPLFDPDRFLTATAWITRPLFTVWGFLLWLALIGTGIALTATNWPALTSDITDRVLSTQNVVLIALAFPLVKAVHELGHAYATKVWDGEVHEIGILFLVFIPVPYVDASASSAFPETWRRVVVGAAGIMVELALAAGALVFWLNAEPGLARAFAFNVMLIGGVSTLLFNGNPLLRFDGYFVLTDVLEIPNLGQRSAQYLLYLVQRYLLGVDRAESPVTARGERAWFSFYAIASFCYRISISLAIALFIAQKFFFIGVLLAIWALSNVLVIPLLKGLRYLLTSSSLRGRRARAVSLAGGAAAGLGAMLFAVPMPHATTAQGVIWLDEDAILRAGTDGFVAEVPHERALVGPGTVLVRMEDPELDSQARLAQARLEEVRLRLARVIGSDPVQANMLRQQVKHLDARLALYRARRDALTVTAAHGGEALIPNADDLPGRMLHEGDVLGYLLSDRGMRLRVAVPQASAELVRTHTERVEVRLQRDIGHVMPARIVAAAPQGEPVLPSPALATGAGGPFALDPSDPQRRRTLQRLFVFDVAPLGPEPRPLVGERALVRFDHGPEPVGYRLYRALRQLFLSRFNV